ncbi:hypothetical protein [Pseudoruegeria aquimaris]|uniref:hypothetical protein n=1 Tax=Pseudoruegeria aquimaris TaxID=393663 RepID=UPI000A26E273|nr:hypothetical protein [Pseudoruegeria aquimaris]
MDKTAVEDFILKMSEHGSKEQEFSRSAELSGSALASMKADSLLSSKGLCSSTSKLQVSPRTRGRSKLVSHGLKVIEWKLTAG